MVISQGEIWWADLPAPAGSGPGFRRSVAVVQSDALNQSRISTVVCVPLTSNLKWAIAPGNVSLSARVTGLPKDSVANVSQVISLDKSLLTERVGKLPRPKLELLFWGSIWFWAGRNLSQQIHVSIPASLNSMIRRGGQIVNIPGKLVDILTDQARSRLYILRQDIDTVLVYDAATLQRIAFLRTGNTPTQMAFSADQKYLIVGNDNSQLANVFDLDTLSVSAPIFFPGGHSPRSIGVAQNGIYALSRLQVEPPTCTPEISGAAILDHVDFANRTADTPCTLSAGPNRSIYQNGLPSTDGVLTSTPANDYLLLALADGNVIEYDDSVQSWVASRSDFTGLGGAYAALSKNLFWPVRTSSMGRLCRWVNRSQRLTGRLPASGC